nr:sigma-70 family RNA polymerase sigma factor [Thermomonospora umbrina]
MATLWVSTPTSGCALSSRQRPSVLEGKPPGTPLPLLAQAGPHANSAWSVRLGSGHHAVLPHLRGLADAIWPVGQVPGPSSDAVVRPACRSSSQLFRSPTSRSSTPERLPGVRHKPFEAIIAEHGSTVWRVCRAVLDPGAAEDAWSETFLAAMRAYPELPPDSNVEAWLVTIAHRKAIDQVRAEARRPVLSDDLPERRSTEGIPGSTDHDLLDAVKALPLKQRQTVAYHYLAGLPYKEVAEIVGGSPEAARRSAADGVTALRKIYQTDSEGERR